MLLVAWRVGPRCFLGFDRCSVLFERVEDSVYLVTHNRKQLWLTTA